MNFDRILVRSTLFLLFFCWSTLNAQTPPPAALVETLSIINGKPAPWAIEVDVTFGKTAQKGSLRIDRPTDGSYRVAIEAMDRSAVLERTGFETRLISGAKQVAFVAQGNGDALPLAPAGLVGLMISQDSLISLGIGFLGQGDPAVAASMLMSIADLRPQPDGTYASTAHRFTMKAGERELTLTQNENVIAIRHVQASAIPSSLPAGVTPQNVDRSEMEWMIKRAMARGSEILAPGPRLSAPDHSPKTVSHGELFWVENQRVVLLNGTPEEIGKAHGESLAEEARRCMDSTISLVGLGKSIEDGRWLPDEFRDAWKRLSPHIPEAYLKEMDALATAIGVDPETYRLSNIFPEFFHCSGFALFGSATRDGKLYHGRVLDYMSVIGLHHSATVFIVKPTVGHAYVNVGYAGFVGSVTGMNDAEVSLGEMGGGGVGQWDGVPMSILMRRALEECGTLDDVKKLWADSPRTCEYYYVWADGKTRTAVGVAATPEKIEFIEPGQAHPKLGEGIPNAVTLSAGNRLKALRERVTAQLGQVDEKSAVDLMCAPVAMSSNLHNVLFVPEDLVLYVAHGNGNKPAYELPYTKLDVAALFEQVKAVK